MTTTSRWLRLAAILLAVAALAAACGGSEEVGDESLLEGTEENGDGPRLGETTTTTAAPDEPGATTTAPPTTTPPTTAAAAGPSLEVEIFSDDTSGGQFQPRVGQVASGSIVRFVNRDDQPRSVVADSGAFDSGPIAPGASWDWVAAGAGSYNYADGTRPYAVGSIEVV